MSPPRILVVDDEPDLAYFLSQALEAEGFGTRSAADGPSGLAAFRAGDVDLLLLDVNLPGLSGLEVLRAVLEERPDTPVVMISAYDTTEVAVRCMRAGARDYIQKPLQLDELLIRIRRVLQESRRDRIEAIASRRPAPERPAGARLIGSSAGMATVRGLIEKAAASSRTTVLVTGESGTGKELVARALHVGEGPFVAVNCTAIPENLLESELFGHEKGAFTDARETRQGYFELAHRGTLFLDEVGDLPAPAQAKLLRVLQEKVVQRVGGRTTIPVDVHVVAATNRDLGEAIRLGQFREDLYYRLAVFPIPLPPLRQRGEDIPALADHFLAALAPQLGRRARRLSPGALGALVRHPWPGNIRELQNVIERALLLAEGDEIGVADLGLRATPAGPVGLAGAAAPSGPRPPPREAGAVGAAGDDPLQALAATPLTLDELERAYVQAVLARCQGRRGEAAVALGIDPKTLYRKLKRWGGGGDPET